MPKVSALAAATLPLTGTETVYVVQGGNSRKSDVNAIMARVAPTLNATGSAPIYACRAWVNFNGTGAVAIRGSGNVSSITDNAVGDYTVNFTTAMQDANYAVIATSGGANTFIADAAAAPTVSAVRIQTINGTGVAFIDPTFVNVAIFR